MEIYLDHEFNGSMVVYSEAEAGEWAKKGWLKRPSKNTTDKQLALMGLKRDGDKIVPVSAKPTVDAAPVASDAPAPAKKTRKKAAE